jgi:predicted ferric reductase
MTDNTMAGWEPLHSRRHSRKLNLFYKIRNNDSPLYLSDCLLPFIREENELNLRNQTEFRNPFTRLQLFANSSHTPTTDTEVIFLCQLLLYMLYVNDGQIAFLR